MDTTTKFVAFEKYCKTCKHRRVPEADDPCDTCLGEPTNTNSHKPTKWEAE